MPKKGPKKNKGHRGLDVVDLANMMFRVIQKRPSQWFTLEDLAWETNTQARAARPLQRAAMDMLVESNQVTLKNDQYRLAMSEQDVVEGILDLTISGTGYVVTPHDQDDVFVKAAGMGLALGGDRVTVQLYPKRGRRKPEGEIIEVVERARQRYVGVLEVTENTAFLITDDKKVGPDFYISKRDLGGGQHGQMVAVELLEWTDPEKSPAAKVVDVLGAPGEHSAEIHAIMAEYALPEGFPPEVLAEAEKISMDLDPEEIARRRDMRGVTTFTIDPADAKDFDDALSIQPTENGLWEIGIHIADVTHYVTPGSALEKEAVDRATSVYLVDRVIPMLPEHISNKVCSLRPDEDKFTFSAILTMDKDGMVQDRWFGRTVIHSQRRFTYEEAQRIIEGEDGDLASEIRLMDGIAKKLRARRSKSGAIEFDRAEVKFRLDADNQPIGVYLKRSQDANKLIEEFMLLANREVASFVGRTKDGKKNTRAMVYRVHDHPNPEKLLALRQFVRPLGYQVQVDSPMGVRQSLNAMLANVKGTPEANMLETLALRTMAKAVYSTDNIGHYGLAFDDYTHFTSPIRRYPDMMVHRLLQHYLDGGRSSRADKYAELCDHSSSMEQLATEAERASVKYMQAVYMEQYLGKEMPGIVTGVSDWGLYVEVEGTGCEGLLRLREFTDDYYILDQENYRIVGERWGREFRLGDAITIVVKEVSLQRKTIDFGMPGAPSYRRGGSNQSNIGRYDDTRPSDAGERWSGSKRQSSAGRGGTKGGARKVRGQAKFNPLAEPGQGARKGKGSSKPKGKKGKGKKGGKKRR